MRYIRIETDDETRWINLEQVVRATLTRHGTGGVDLLVVFFANSLDECVLKIDGSSKRNIAAIKILTAALDAAATAP